MGIAAAEKESTGSLHDSANNDNAAVNLETAPVHAVPVVPAGTTERRILTKIDLHVVPFLCIMYLLAFLGMFARASSDFFNIKEKKKKDRTRFAN